MVNIKKIAPFFSTFFLAGYFPVASGTFASLVATVIIYFLLKADSYYIAIPIFTAALVCIGFLSVRKTLPLFDKEDPQEIVIDEVLGLFIVFCFIRFGNTLSSLQILIKLLVGFLLFRFFDIVKPFFINKSQQLKGATGVLADDILAGIISNLILRMIYYLI